MLMLVALNLFQLVVAPAKQIDVNVVSINKLENL